MESDSIRGSATRCSSRSATCPGAGRSKARGSGSRSSPRSSAATAAASGPRAMARAARASTSPFPSAGAGVARIVDPAGDAARPAAPGPDAAGRRRDDMPRFSALVVDDDTSFRESLSLLVAREGYDVRQGASLDEARRHLAEAPADVVLVDLGLPDGIGLELLRGEPIAAGCEIVLITGNASVETAVDALREGALDYLTKPVDRQRL